MQSNLTYSLPQGTQIQGLFAAHRQNEQQQLSPRKTMASKGVPLSLPHGRHTTICQPHVQRAERLLAADGGIADVQGANNLHFVIIATQDGNTVQLFPFYSAQRSLQEGFTLSFFFFFCQCSFYLFQTSVSFLVAFKLTQEIPN